MGQQPLVFNGAPPYPGEKVKVPNRRRAKRMFLLSLSEIFSSKCCYCATVLTWDDPNCESHASLDHFIPLSEGGGNGSSNLVPACRQCNMSKRSQPALSWYRKQPAFSWMRWYFIMGYLEEHLSLAGRDWATFQAKVYAREDALNPPKDTVEYTATSMVTYVPEKFFIVEQDEQLSQN